MKKYLIAIFVIIMLMMTVIAVSAEDFDFSDTAEDCTKAHSFSGWVIVIPSAYDERGLMVRDCSICGYSEEQSTPMIPLPFVDVRDSHWFADSVKYCLQRGYVKGMNESAFVPDGYMTRAQFLVMLAKLDGIDLSAYEGEDSGFEDVKPSHWYNPYVCWAAENKLTAGLTPTAFGPNDNLTRSQLARFLYVYSEKKGIAVDGRGDLSVFPDAASVSGWAVDSVSWAVYMGIIGGVAKDGINYLTPNGTSTRAQAAVMFTVFDKVK